MKATDKAPKHMVETTERQSGVGVGARGSGTGSFNCIIIWKQS